MGGIYQISIRDNTYVGSTIGSFEKRFKKHLNDLIADKHCNFKMKRLYKKYNEITFKILENVEDKAIILIREQFFIDTLKPNINICLIAGNSTGRVVTDETKEKIRSKLIGKSLSVELVKKLSSIRKGKTFTKEHKANIAKSAKLSKEKYRKRIVQRTLDGDIVKIWESVSDIATQLNYHKGNICACCKETKKSYKGFIWTYDEQDISPMVVHH